MSENRRAAAPPHDRMDRPARGAPGRDPVGPGVGYDDTYVDAHVIAAPAPPPRPAVPHRPLPPHDRPAPPRRDGLLGWLPAALVYSGAALVGASIYQNQRSREAEADHPPIGRFLDADGATLHYVDIGEGPPIVLLHGVVTTLDDWFVSGVIDALLPHHRIIAIDRPGHGYSSRPGGIRWSPERQARSIARLLHRLGAHEATVVAHSFGALPALALALQHPTFARSLVLIAGTTMPGSTLGRVASLVPSVPLLGPLARGSISPAVARAAMPAFIRALFEPQPVSREFRNRFSVDFATRPGQLRAITDDLAEMDRATRRFAPHYAGLAVPVTVITGSGDAIVDPDRQSRAFARAVPDARLMVVPAGGHAVHHTSPGRVAEAILDTAAGHAHADDPGPPPDRDAGRLGDEPAKAERRPRAAASRAAAAKTSAAASDESGRDTGATSKPERRASAATVTGDTGDGPSVSTAVAAAETDAESRSDPAPPPPRVGPANAAGASPKAASGTGADGDDDGADGKDDAPPKRRRTRSRRKTS